MQTQLDMGCSCEVAAGSCCWNMQRYAAPGHSKLEAEPALKPSQALLTMHGPCFDGIILASSDAAQQVQTGCQLGLRACTDSLVMLT